MPDNKQPELSATKRSGGWRALLTPHDPLTSLLLTIPVFLVYHLGVLTIDLRNGVDLVTQITLQLLSGSLAAYIGLTLLYAVGIASAATFLKKKGSIATASLRWVLVESLVLAVIMASTVGWATSQIFAWQVGPRPLGVVEKVVMAAGAGFHEELVFRVIMFGGLVALITRLKSAKPQAVVVMGCALLCAALFSGIHYVGSMADDFSFVSFGFRFLAGLFLTAVFAFRGFAVAVYTHTLYDLLVFFVWQH